MKMIPELQAAKAETTCKYESFALKPEYADDASLRSLILTTILINKYNIGSPAKKFFAFTKDDKRYCHNSSLAMNSFIPCTKAHSLCFRQGID